MGGEEVEGGILMNATSVIFKKFHRALKPLPPCEDTTRSLQPGQGPHLTVTSTLILDFPPLTLEEIHFCCLLATKSVALCYSS